MVIYTKKGDKGETGLYQERSKKRRVAKNSPKIEAIGTIDELNSAIGVSLSYCKKTRLKNLIKDIQKDLFTIGAILAGSPLRFPKTRTKKLERVIDESEGRLPVLKSFILPGGTKLSSHLHFARTVTRRAEREVVALNQIENIKPQILTYLNRLSDLFFVLAREVNRDAGRQEEVWQGAKK